jgi:hypothetical protein
VEVGGDVKITSIYPDTRTSFHGFAHAAGIKCFGRNASIGSVNKVSGTLVLILMNFAVFAHYG